MVVPKMMNLMNQWYCLVVDLVFAPMKFDLGIVGMLEQRVVDYLG